MPRYWFRQKRFGYGATPITWEGWALTLIGAAAIFAVVFETRHIPDRTTQTLVTMAGILVVALPFCLISYFKTDGGWRWRWGNED